MIRETFYLDQDTEILASHGPGQLDGWDSLGHANLVIALEATYGISLNLDEILAIESVSDVKTLLADKGINLE